MELFQLLSEYLVTFLATGKLTLLALEIADRHNPSNSCWNTFARTTVHCSTSAAAVSHASACRSVTQWQTLNCFQNSLMRLPASNGDAHIMEEKIVCIE